jgi:hypothetical protein
MNIEDWLIGIPVGAVIAFVFYVFMRGLMSL